MGIPVLIMGDSGSGKSCSVRNFTAEEVGIFNVAGKPLPFRNKLPTVNATDYNSIMSAMAKGSRNAYIIDDSQYLMCFESFSKAKETGYGKFTDFALHFYNLVQFVIRQLPPEKIVYFLHHTEVTDQGKTKAKTIGKMLDNQLTLEGLFAIVLICQTDGKNHQFVTQSDGYTTAKSPMDMLPLTMENDLKAVDTAIREYYELKNNKEETK